MYDYSLVYLHMPNSYGLVFVDKCNELIHEEGEMHMPNSYVKVFVDKNNELIHEEGERFYQKITAKSFLDELHLCNLSKNCF